MTITLEPTCLWAFPISAVGLLIVLLFTQKQKLKNGHRADCIFAMRSAAFLIAFTGCVSYGSARTVRNHCIQSMAKGEHFWEQTITEMQKTDSPNHRDVFIFNHKPDTTYTAPLTQKQFDSIIDGAPPEVQATMRPMLLEYTKDARNGEYISACIAITLIFLLLGVLIIIFAS